jgi:UDP-glucose:(heptosyl)LPS alpha-1,3-glucosyltransferase
MRLALNFFRVDPGKGGAETYVADLARALVADGHRVDLLAHDWRDDALPAEVRRVQVPAPGYTRRQRTWNFAVNSETLLRRVDYDCTVGFINTWYHDVIIPQGGVHAASLEANARRFPSGCGRRLYLAAKWCNPKAWTYQTIERRQYDPARGAHVVAVSRYVRGHLERYHNVPRSRIHVIPNAIDADRLAVADPVAARRAFRSHRGIPPGSLVALFVAHNFRLKGLGPLLEALALRVRRDPAARPIHLLVCGGDRPAAFRRQARRLGINDVVHFAGFVPDVAEAYAASDLFVLPTYYDPCSLVVFEALARGLPVITTACNGAGEMITPGREGFVVQSPDALDHLADALDRMADDAARLAMARDAERLGRAQSFDRHVARLVALFEDVAAAKAGKRSVAAA